jgi:hypothetical protein
MGDTPFDERARAQALLKISTCAARLCRRSAGLLLRTPVSNARARRPVSTQHGTDRRTSMIGNSDNPKDVEPDGKGDLSA